MNRRAGRLLQARSELAEELVALLKTRPLHLGLKLDLALVGLDINADQNWNSSVRRHCRIIAAEIYSHAKPCELAGDTRDLSPASNHDGSIVVFVSSWRSSSLIAHRVGFFQTLYGWFEILAAQIVALLQHTNQSVSFPFRELQLVSPEPPRGEPPFPLAAI